MWDLEAWNYEEGWEPLHGGVLQEQACAKPEQRVPTSIDDLSDEKIEHVRDAKVPHKKIVSKCLR